jgi:hypothetical protein
VAAVDLRVSASNLASDVARAALQLAIDVTSNPRFAGRVPKWMSPRITDSLSKFYLGGTAYRIASWGWFAAAEATAFPMGVRARDVISEAATRAKTK